MSNLGAVLKQEIRRLARKEARLTQAPLRKARGLLRKQVRNLKAEIVRLDLVIRRLAAELKRCCAVSGRAAPAAERRLRVTAKGIRSLRRKLRLTQAEFAALVGVTGQAVCQWERRGRGAIRVRTRVREALARVRGLGARDARRLLDNAGKPARRRRRK